MSRILKRMFMDEAKDWQVGSWPRRGAIVLTVCSGVAILAHFALGESDCCAKMGEPNAPYGTVS